MDSVSFVDKSFTKDLSYIDYNVSKNFFLKSQKNSTFLLDFSSPIYQKNERAPFGLSRFTSSIFLRLFQEYRNATTPKAITNKQPANVKTMAAPLFIPVPPSAVFLIVP